MTTEVNRKVRTALSVDIEIPEGTRTVRVDGKDETYDLIMRATTATVARDSGLIPMSAWKNGGLDHFRQNPVILWAHNHNEPPIGRSVRTEVDGDELIEYWRFNRVTDLSRQVALLYEIGDLRASSIGWMTKEERAPTDEEIEAAEADGRELCWVATKAELLETSAVPVPADPNAVAVEQAIARCKSRGARVEQCERDWYRLKSICANQVRTVIPFSVHSNYEVASRDADWDARSEVSEMEATEDALRMRHAWVDTEEDADTKSAYKFPHHRAGDGMAVVFRALANGFARLDQADASESDKKGIAEHLGRHYQEDFDAEPPKRSDVARLMRGVRDLPEGMAMSGAFYRLFVNHIETLARLGGGDIELAMEAVLRSLHLDESDEERASALEPAINELNSIWMDLQEKIPAILEFLKDKDSSSESPLDAETDDETKSADEDEQDHRAGEAEDQAEDAEDAADVRDSEDRGVHPEESPSNTDPDRDVSPDPRTGVTEDQVRAIIREKVPDVIEAVERAIYRHYGTE